MMSKISRAFPSSPSTSSPPPPLPLPLPISSRPPRPRTFNTVENVIRSGAHCASDQPSYSSSMLMRWSWHALPMLPPPFLYI